MDPLTVAIFSALFGGPVWLILGLCFFPWRAKLRYRLWMLVLMVPPAFSWLWGILFVVTPGTRPVVPVWIAAAPWLSLATALILVAILPFTIARTYRFSSIALGLAALSATLITSFVALMNVTGDYI